MLLLATVAHIQRLLSRDMQLKTWLGALGVGVLVTAFRNIHALHHDYYTLGGGIGREADHLQRVARVMLSKTKIIPNLERALVLLDVFERLPPATDADGHKRHFDVFRLLTDCYEPIADDVLLLSAFEIHAKAHLFRRGYVIHEIASPTDLKKQQRTAPVHVRSIRAASRRGAQCLFREVTIGISVLLESKYVKHFRVPGPALKAVEEVRERRNLVHFGEPYVWGVDRSLPEFVAHLDRSIPYMKVRRVRRA